jgi:hypothetical protein
LDESRITLWSNAGSSSSPDYSLQQVNVLDFGADPTGSYSSRQAYVLAVEALNNQAGTIYFPVGEYYFESGISIPDSVRLQGESTETVLRFNLGGAGNLIHITGSSSPQQFELVAPVLKGANVLSLSNAEHFEVGDVMRLSCNDEEFMHSTWAHGSLGQVVEIIGKNGNDLLLADPITTYYPLDLEPSVRKVNAVRGVKISCMKLEREDATSSQTSNIYIRNAIDCAIENVESQGCNFSHIEVNSSAHISISGSYLHHAHAYGGGGQGYGVVFQATSSFCLAENNVFEHLRHSMLLQSGATGNVFGYNYSIDPYWESGMLPSNSAGDAVLHGNYPHHNLFEGNVIQNMVVDASHGFNGPFNTFFRNRGELYGFFSDSGTPTDSMNIIGNEITNSGFPLGLFMVNGNGHFQFGNNVYGSTIPASTQDLETITLYQSNNAISGSTEPANLPLIGYPNLLGNATIPPQNRYFEGVPTNCESLVITSTEHSELIDETRPFIQNHELILPKGLIPATLEFYTTTGSLVATMNIKSEKATLPPAVTSGIYLVRCSGQNGQSNFKVLISR